MGIFAPEKWPLVAISVAMLVAAFIDGWKFKVPNWLTLPVIVIGWLLGAAYDLSLLTAPVAASPTWCPRFVAAFFVMMVGFCLLAPIRALKMVGGGDVKMQMGFASWMGAFYGLYGGTGVFLWGYALGVMAGGVIGAIMILTSGRIKTHMDNFREILADVATVNAKTIADNAVKRKPRMKLLPYGIPLCVGYIAYLVYLNW